MAGIRTTTVTNCFIRLATREPFHSQLAPQGCHSSWLYALFFSASCSSPFYFVFFFQHAAEDNVTHGWMNGWTGMCAAGGRCFFEIEPINADPDSWTYKTRSPTYRPDAIERLARSFSFVYRRSSFLEFILRYLSKEIVRGVNRLPCYVQVENNFLCKITESLYMYT